MMLLAILAIYIGTAFVFICKMTWMGLCAVASALWFLTVEAAKLVLKADAHLKES